MFSLMLIIFLLANTVNRCSGYEFAAAGEVTIKDFDRGQIISETNYAFTAEVNGDNSRIRVFSGIHSIAEFIEYGWDTTDSYLLIKFLTNRTFKVVNRLVGGKITTVTLDNPIKPQNHATLTLFANDELPQHNCGFEPIWLAYASSSHFRVRESGKKIESVWDMGDKVRESKILFTSAWHLSANAPYLLQNMTDFADGNKYETTGSKPVAVRMNKPFDTEFTNSYYEVLSWTNVAGMTLPQRFRVTRYVPDSDAGSLPSLLVWKVYEGVANQIWPKSNSTNFSARMPDESPTQVLDKRFSHAVEPVDTKSYFSPTGKVMKVEEVKTNEAYKQALGGREPNFKPRKSRSVLIWIFLLSLTFPIWLLAKRKPEMK